MIGSFKLPISGSTEDWVRPSNWLPIPPIATGEQVVYALMAVTNSESNHIAFLFQGAYTVDWGDGNTENVATNTQAQHNYAYADVSNEITRNGLTYKQALIKITPQSGQNLTLCDWQRTHTALPTAGIENYKVLDFVFNVPNISGTSFTLGGTTTRYNSAERVWIKEVGVLTSCLNLFREFHILQNVPLFNIASVTTTQTMFMNCYSLQSVPLFNTVSVITMTNMFYGCYSLQSVPLFNTENATGMTGMFLTCYSLQSVPLFNTVKVTTMQEMFYNAVAIKYIPQFNTVALTTISGMLRNCTGLLNANLNYSAVTTVDANIFNLTESLESLILTGMRYGFNITNANLSATALNALFTSLGTAAGAQTIVVTGNIGAATCDTTIATGKGFTVTI